MKKIIIALSIAVLTFVNSVSALTATEVQETLKKEFDMDNSVVIKLQESFGDDVSHLRIDSVYDFGVILRVSNTGEPSLRLIGFDGSVNDSPIVFSNGFAIVQCGEKWGVINDNYEWKLPPVFDDTYPNLSSPHMRFINDIALLRYGDKSFVINSECEIVDIVPTKESTMLDTSTVFCENSDGVYIWKDNNKIELELPEGCRDFYIEETPFRAHNGFIAITEKPMTYHVFDSKGEQKYSFDCEKKIGKGTYSWYNPLVNGGASIGVDGHYAVICDGYGNIIKERTNYSPAFACASGGAWVYGGYMWEDNYCYDEKLDPVFNWKLERDETLLVGGGENYIAFMPIRMEELKDHPILIGRFLGDEIVVVIGDEANPMQNPQVADPKKIDELLNSAKDEISVFMNGGILKFDTNPIMVNDRVLVPMRKIFEEIGATVSWDEERQCAKAVKDDVIIEISIGESFFEKNGKQIPIDVPAQLENDRTLVPLRAVSEAFDLNVDWIEELNMVSIL